MNMNRKEKKLQEENEFLKDMIESFEDLKAGRVKVFK
jgi:hypothetical protein